VTWQDRLSEAAYTSPSGTRMRFSYADVSSEIDKRTASFEFPGIAGAYVQDNGPGARRFPLVCYFSGPDCDREAQAFEALLLERGAGRLEHPLYGKHTVVPFGTLARRDDLLSGANQTILEVVFWSTLGAVYPSSGLSPKHNVNLSIGFTRQKLAAGFARKTNLLTAARRANTALTVRQALRNIQAAMRKVAGVTESINREFRDLQQQVNFGLDVLIGTPLLMAQQLLNLISAPGRALTGILSRLQGYADLLDRLLGSSRSTPGDVSVLPALQLRLSNDFHTADLLASGAVIGSLTSVLHHTFTAKPQALEAAEALLAQADALTEWQDGRYGDLEQIDTGEGYQSLQETVALAVGFLVEISFSLVPERALVLDRPRSIIDLCAELYGSVDDRLDFLISTNRLTGSDIIELPRGRRVLYYV
jgi:prophage DNA circulation protein